MTAAQPKKVLVKKPQTNIDKQELTSEQSANHEQVLDDRLKLKQQSYEEAKARILSNQTILRNQKKYNQEFPQLSK
ncbi:unnamed protein product (macronuclear) [Paramecium tetraurelia]|uniref:No apical meristem-associated C-terminal domain-containing protein n=1 Tax=Paramecium tetraurelia TaxID=5888 RepID=A0CXA6_PARTE|nr:uncharacterized protein GSPATT00011055001 [Paramecium tetraurelia]CAK75423.1 unnamed protein product [Paramecium tetraurelia]|eukprot:XP_001442820.1 hypothetical protein (macronuclear) [Paramecium tetraurelia strain d4-2]